MQEFPIRFCIIKKTDFPFFFNIFYTYTCVTYDDSRYFPWRRLSIVYLSTQDIYIHRRRIYDAFYYHLKWFKLKWSEKSHKFCNGMCAHSHYCFVIIYACIIRVRKQNVTHVFALKRNNKHHHHHTIKVHEWAN